MLVSCTVTVTQPFVTHMSSLRVGIYSPEKVSVQDAVVTETPHVQKKPI